VPRISDPHPCHADPDPGIEIMADPDPGFEIVAVPDPGLDFFGSKCGSRSRDLKKC